MKAFAKLVNDLDSSNKTSLKTEAIQRFLRDADDKDKLWLLALFTGKRPKRHVGSGLMKQWAMEIAGIPEWLFIESYSSVGDLGETIALILPPPQQQTEKPLYAWMQDIIALADATEAEKRYFVLHAWNNLNTTERFIFNKLLGGSFRVGLSSKGLINALAKHYALDETAVAHSIMGEWRLDDVEFEPLIHGHYSNTFLSKPYPFCLAYALETPVERLAPLSEWQAEYKWDGIRGQLVKRAGEVFIWSRGEELVTSQFPEVVATAQQWDEDFVIDGEILPIKEGAVLNFSELQKRLNRKLLTRKILTDTPVGMYAYDLLEWKGEDIRLRPLQERRALLEMIVESYSPASIQLSPVVSAVDPESLLQLRETARERNSEGLMLKHRRSIYHTGRKKGDWWKWKIDPLTIDAVLIYAQKGSGRRSAYYSDYTFAVRDGDMLVTIAKAYSGLTDKEIQEVSRFVNKNAIEKFGPVRTVKPELVFEIAFEGIGYSSRHKSGVALRFPRIARWRKDKTVQDIDDLETVKRLIT